MTIAELSQHIGFRRLGTIYIASDKATSVVIIYLYVLIKFAMQFRPYLLPLPFSQRGTVAISCPKVYLTLA